MTKSIELKLEKARPEDFEILTQIAFESKASLGYNSSIIEAWKHELVVSSDMISNSISFVVKAGDQIIAFWCREPVEHLSDGRLFVRPEFQRQGCGRLLWKAVMTEARRRGLKKMEWEADYKVLPYYIKIGAKVIGEKASEFVPDLKFPIVGVVL